jgi:hypothetical protein
VSTITATTRCASVSSKSLARYTIIQILLPETCLKRKSLETTGASPRSPAPAYAYASVVEVGRSHVSNHGRRFQLHRRVNNSETNGRGEATSPESRRRLVKQMPVMGRGGRPRRRFGVENLARIHCLSWLGICWVLRRASSGGSLFPRPAAVQSLGCNNETKVGFFF